jgi:uncharacterized protein (DUF2249 family)
MEFRLDVCGLPAPEPMELILGAVQGLKEGDYLKAIHNREPFPLYSMLNDDGFFYHTIVGGKAGFLIFIWRSDDAKAELAVEARIEQESQ